ncbi:MAG: flagellar hook protein FlgE [Caulobacteraceae bacterium]|nr:flagellar hook protein FlgE [Caulobacteraceae bacterium]
MSLSAALSSAVSGLSAQSLAISSISENIANASTTAYKTKQTDFEALVTGGSTSDNSTSGVIAMSKQAMLVQGLVSSTGVATNVAIQGGGFFIVADSSTAKPAQYVYTRDGSFTTNAQGYLVNSQGYYLYGYPTDAAGAVTASANSNMSGLEPISTSAIAGTAKATSAVSMSANLPADAALGATYNASMEIIDSLGVSHTIDQTWTKTAANTWSLSLANPYVTGSPGAPSGVISPSTMTVTFDGQGVLSSTSPSPSTLSISGFTSGANNSAITLNLGAAGSTSGLTQYASTSSTPSLEGLTVKQDGVRYGKLTGVSVNAAGLVTAAFDNGLSQPIYQIPVATFPNVSGLAHLSGTIYGNDQDAGAATVTLPNQGGAGAIVADALEGSTTDTATEFNKMIMAQQAYSAAAQVVNTVNSMFTTLMQSMK